MKRQPCTHREEFRRSDSNGFGPEASHLLQDPRVERLPCMHSGSYADDCICERVRQHRCYIVATCDRDLRRRLRKVHQKHNIFLLKQDSHSGWSRAL